MAKAKKKTAEYGAPEPAPKPKLEIKAAFRHRLGRLDKLVGGTWSGEGEGTYTLGFTPTSIIFSGDATLVKLDGRDVRVKVSGSGTWLAVGR